MLRQTRVKIYRLLASLGLVSAEILVVNIIFFTGVFLFPYLIRDVFILHDTRIDETVFLFIKNYVSPGNTKLMQAITFLGTHYFLIPANILLAAYFFFISRHKWYSVKIIAITLSSTALMFLLKFAFVRERPLMPLLKPALGYSFPSGHSLMGFAFYGLIIHILYHYIKNGYIKWILIIALVFLIFLIGVSRVYLRVHYPTDVLAGFSIGIIWLMLSLWILKVIERYSKKTIEPVIEHSM